MSEMKRDFVRVIGIPMLILTCVALVGSCMVSVFDGSEDPRPVAERGIEVTPTPTPSSERLGISSVVPTSTPTLAPPRPTATPKPKPKSTHKATAPKPKPKPRQTAKPKPKPASKPRTVHPGAFCSPEGATGIYNGRTYHCKGPGQPRWRR